MFNAGERINALTSPLYALMCAGLCALTGATLTPARALGFALMLAASLLALRRWREAPGWMALKWRCS